MRWARFRCDRIPEERALSTRTGKNKVILMFEKRIEPSAPWYNGRAWRAQCAGVMVLLVLLLITGCTAMGQWLAPEPPPTCAINAEELARDFGLQPIAFHVLSDGRSSEFRYRVLDAQKALPVLDQVVRPMLIRVESGEWYEARAPIQVGNIELLKLAPDPSRLHFLRIVHPSLDLYPGEGVTLELGDVRVECMIVEPLPG